MGSVTLNMRGSFRVQGWAWKYGGMSELFEQNCWKSINLGIFLKLLFCRWGVILVLAVQHLTKKNTHIGLYDSVEKPLKIFQSAAILEVNDCQTYMYRT